MATSVTSTSSLIERIITDGNENIGFLKRRCGSVNGAVAAVHHLLNSIHEELLQIQSIFKEAVRPLLDFVTMNPLLSPITTLQLQMADLIIRYSQVAIKCAHMVTRIREIDRCCSEIDVETSLLRNVLTQSQAELRDDQGTVDQLQAMVQRMPCRASFLVNFHKTVQLRLNEAVQLYNQIDIASNQLNSITLTVLPSDLDPSISG